MNLLQKKIQKESKVMAVILMILSISLILGILIPIAILIWIAIKPNADILLFNGWGIYSSTGKALESIGEVKAEMCTIITAGILIASMLLKAYTMFRSISKDVAPFNKSNAQKLKSIAIVLIVYAIVVPIARAGFYQSFAPEIRMNTSVDAPYVVLALIFFFIALLFNYGAELQRESDELL